MPIIVTAHNKGGAGKTTSAIHLIGELKPKKLIDLDLHHQISLVNGLRPEEKQIPVSSPTSQEELVEELESFQNDDGILFIDCGGFDSDLTRTAVAYADIVLVPSKDSLPERIGLIEFDDVLKEVSEIIGRNIRAHLFLCKTNPLKKHFPKLQSIITDFKHLELMDSRLSYRPQDFEETIESGFGITESLHGRSTGGGKEVIAMVEEIKEIIGKF